jgi:hypothetical protein
MRDHTASDDTVDSLLIVSSMKILVRLKASLDAGVDFTAIAPIESNATTVAAAGRGHESPIERISALLLERRLRWRRGDSLLLRFGITWCRFDRRIGAKAPDAGGKAEEEGSPSEAGRPLRHFAPPTSNVAHNARARRRGACSTMQAP